MLPLQLMRAVGHTLTFILFVSWALLCTSLPLQENQCPTGCENCSKEAEDSSDSLAFTTMTCDFHHFYLSHHSIPRVKELYWQCNETTSSVDVIDHVIRSLAYPEEVTKMVFKGCNAGDLKPGTFHSCSSLRVLEIVEGNLTYFDPHAFTSLSSLEHLVISGHPLLNVIQRPSATDDYPAIDAIANSTYVPNENLTISHPWNHTTPIPSVQIPISVPMPNITYLDLSMNGITTLSTEFFEIFRNIQVLNLQSNSLSNLSEISFSQLPMLKAINLNNNSISNVPDNMFSNVRNLMNISLAHNKINDSVIYVEGSESVSSLDLSFNVIENLSRAFFQGLNAIQHLNLAYNNISQISSAPSNAFAEFKMLRNLNISHNMLTDIQENYFNNLYELINVDLSYNKITRISPESFNGVKKLLSLNLAFNLLTNFQPFPQLNLEENSPIVKVTMEGNPIHCDCHMAVTLFGDYSNDVKKDIYPLWPHSVFFANQQFVNLQSVICDTLPNSELNGFPSNTSIGSFEMNGYDQFFCDEEECPDNCTCYSFPVALEKNGFITQCTFLELTNLPYGIAPVTNIFLLTGNSLTQILPDTFPILPHLSNLFMDFNKIVDIDDNGFKGFCNLTTLSIADNSLTEIRASIFQPLRTLVTLSLQYNHIKHIDPGSFANNKRLENIDLGNNDLRILPDNFANETQLINLNLQNNRLISIPESFRDLIYLEILDLSYNRLSSLPVGIFDKLLTGLTYLYLDNNQLNSLPEGIFSKSGTTLNLLTLDNNNLTTLSEGTFDNIDTSIYVLSLHNNPWICDCKLTWMKEWLNRSEIVENINDIKCTTLHSELVLPVLDVEVEDFFCPAPTSRPTYRHTRVILIVTVTLVVLMIVVTFAAVLIYRNRRMIRVVVQRMPGYKRFPRRSQPTNHDNCVYKYDIFVSYNSEDLVFVLEELKPRLEKKNYKLHIRDIRAVSEDIHENIVNSMEASNRIIVILSQHYLTSEQNSGYEFSHALAHALDKRVETLLVVQLGDVDVNAANGEVKQYLEKGNKRCIRYHKNNRLFWDKVFEQLPQPRYDLHEDDFDIAMQHINI